MYKKYKNRVWLVPRTHYYLKKEYQFQMVSLEMQNNETRYAIAHRQFQYWLWDIVIILKCCCCVTLWVASWPFQMTSIFVFSYGYSVLGSQRITQLAAGQVSLLRHLRNKALSEAPSQVWQYPLKHNFFFNFNEVKIIYFFLLLLVFWVLYLRNHCLIQGHKGLLLCFLLKVLQF